MDKPQITRTTKPLPFGDLSPLEFEHLCLWLVQREGYLRAEHLGEAGSEQGRDVIAYKPTAAGEQLWYFQSKRYKQIGPATLIAEVDKYNRLAAADPASKPAGIVFVTSATLSAAARQAVREHCAKQGYEVEFWARTELDALVNKYPEVVEKFFGLPAAPAIAALHQLPAPPADFTGRQAELDELLGRINQGGVMISGLRGMGGIGKTTLALVLAERLKSSYPDAQLYLDLRGTSPQPLSSAEAQAHVIRAFHPTAKLPDSEAELGGLYRSVLHGRRALLVMDNAAGGEQIAPLIPPAGCALIVTSRVRFALPGLYPKDLGTLPEDDAHRLLLTIAPRIGEEAGRISDLCGRLPLALRLVASALAEKVNLKPQDYARRLEQAGERLGLVDASLSLSYDLLDERLQAMWRELGVYPATFEVEAAADIWGVERDRAADVLGELIRYSLVEYEPAIDRYSLHDLVRVFAESKLSEEEKSEIKGRHATQYVNVLWRCQELYHQGGASMMAGLALFDLERDNIEAGQAWAAGAAQNNEQAQKICSAYPTAGVAVLALRQHPRTMIRWHEEALHAARMLKDRGAEGAHHCNLGMAYAQLGKPRQAIEHHKQHLAIARELGDRLGEGDALGNLGVAYGDLGDQQQAIEYLEQALSISHEIGDRRGESATLGNLGLVYTDIDPHKAIDYLEQNLSIARAIGNKQSEGIALGNLGKAHALLNDVQTAISYHEQNLAVAREIGDRHSEGVSLINLSELLYHLGRFEKAVADAETALLIFDELESPYAVQMRKRLAVWRAAKNE